jgi:uncharacterized protein
LITISSRKEEFILENYLYEQNLHWDGRQYNSGTERELLSKILGLLDTDQIIALSGIRRCGKSYLLKQIINKILQRGEKPKNILFVNLELPAFIGQAAHSILDQVIATYQKIKMPEGKIFIFLDEIQTLPKWEKWLKYQYDLRKGEFKFIITGSNSQLLSAEFATLLSGRIIEKKLYPFSFKEILNFKELKSDTPQRRVLESNKILAEFDLFLKYGGMPETLAIKDVEIKRELLSSYFSAIIFRDIVPRFSIREGTTLNELAVYLMGQTAEQFNLRKLSEYFRSSRKTIKEFISYLSLAYLFHILPKFSFSAKERELSLKKCYALDNGFASLVPLRFSPDRGKLLENLVLIELVHRGGTVFYGKNGTECDFINVRYDGIRQAIQVCYELTPNNTQRELRGIITAKNTIGCDQVLLLSYNSKTSLEADGLEILVRPVHEWMLD